MPRQKLEILVRRDGRVILCSADQTPHRVGRPKSVRLAGDKKRNLGLVYERTIGVGGPVATNLSKYADALGAKAEFNGHIWTMELPSDAGEVKIHYLKR